MNMPCLLPLSRPAAGQVEEALLEVIEAHQGGKGGRAAAQQYLAALSAAQRYQRDVWF